MEDQQPRMLKKFKGQFQGCFIDCQLLQAELRIEIKSEEISDKIYCFYITNDSFPQELKFCFEQLEQFYNFLEDTSRNNFQLQGPSKLTLLVPIMKKVSRIPVYLTEKKLTKDQMIQQLLGVVQRLKQIQIKYKSIVSNERPAEIPQEPLGSAAMKNQNQEMRRQIIRLTMLNKKFKQQGAKGQTNKIKQVKAELSNSIDSLQEENSALKIQQNALKKQVQQLNNKVRSLQDQLHSQELIIAQLNEQSVNTSNLIKDITGQSNNLRPKEANEEYLMPIINPQGQMLEFRPLPTSINFKFFQFKNNVLTKNKLTTSGQGRLLPSSATIPKEGRFFYKLKMKFPKDPPNIRIGVVGRDLTNQCYINGGDEDALMYYCYSLGKEVIYEGQSKSQGFNLFKNDILILVVDQDRKEVEWHVQGIHYLTSKFTQSMKRAPLIYIFIQLWNNGDEVQILTE